MGHTDVRKDLMRAIVAEMMGPGSEEAAPFAVVGDYEDELITENPLQRYTVGILYEQEVGQDEDVDTSVDGELAPDVPTGDPHLDSLLDVAATTANQYYPSSIGMSFYATGINPALRVRVRWGQYQRCETSDCYVQIGQLPSRVSGDQLFVEHLHYSDGRLYLTKDMVPEVRNQLLELDPDSLEWKRAVYRLYNLSLTGWRRTPHHRVVEIPARTDLQTTKYSRPITDGLEMLCIRRPDVEANCTLFTVSVINTNKGEGKKRAERTFFQVGFSIVPDDKSVRFLDYEQPTDKEIRDPEEASQALLYRNRKVYAVGHGCAVHWNDEGTQLETQVIPYYEVPSAEFDVEELRDLAQYLDMRNLSDWSPLSRDEIITGLTAFVGVYRSWIEEQRNKIGTLELRHREPAERHLAACSAAADRMTRGVELLNDDDVFWAFQLANRAMLMQRYHSGLQAETRYPKEVAAKWPQPDYRGFNASWRPFQLAFMLLTLDGIADTSGDDRELVDLIWFPTGGGKTEAYLGVAAVCIFLRRLRRGEMGYGTTVLMRYTLRLLTAQQFQRASTLVCACEMIRRQIPKLGTDPITIGLWLGHDNTPTRVAEAKKHKDDLEMGLTTVNMFQVLVCPWCGARLTKNQETGEGSWGYRISQRPSRFIIYCTDPACSFHEELPIRIVDDDIYANPPTLLFATVDKFALLPWKDQVSSLFGLDADVDSPDLVIQDELHLISGPLGTIVGLYEVAVDELCSAKGVRPKIVASTATIRRAGEQVRALYARDVSLFPPPGLDAADSFFSREADLSERPGRLYVGLLATGRTLTSTQVRLVASIMQAIHEMDYPEDVKDPYWTLVSYFNTIRELGRCSTLALDDIKDQIRRIAFRHGSPKREYQRAEELTGSRKSADIPTMLERMKCSYPNRNVIDLLHTSNMMSVGIDIDRLALMEVVSQPKATAEYIQATSRVGRKYPGLIVTLLDGARSRDRSHYERFMAYHQSLYRYVEPTSVTPFSGPARDRALRAVLVSLVRHRLGLLRNGDAARFSANLEGLSELVEQVVTRARIVMREEAEATAADLKEYIREWEDIVGMHPALSYTNGKDGQLLYTAGREGKYWPAMQSMRNVDAPGNVHVVD